MSSKKDTVDISKAIIEISNSKLRIDAENENIKEIKKRLKDEHGIDNAMVAKLSELYHKQTIDEFIAKNDEIIDKYEELFGSK